MPSPRARRWPASSRRATRPRRRRATPTRRWSSASRTRASAGRPPTPRSSRRSSAAATCSAKARRWSPASPPSPSRACCGRTSPTTSTSGSPRRWRRTSTRSPAASGRRSTSSATSIAARTAVRGSSSARRPTIRSRIPPPTSAPAAVAPARAPALPIRVRIGRFGPFLARGEGGDGHTASLPDEVAPADFTVDQAVELLNAKAEGPRSLGVHPQTGEQVYLLTGRYGPYVQLGEMPEKGAKGAKAPKPKRASLPKTLFSESTLTLDQALQLLSLPRQVGLHPDDGKPIVANFGPYSPYVKHNTDFRSLDSEAAVFDVTL